MSRIAVSRPYAAVVLPWLLGACHIAQPPEVAWVTIPPGATVGQVADSLAAHRVIKSERAFRRLVRMLGYETAIAPGTYPLRPGPMHSLFPLLLEGRPLAKPVPVPPGIMLSELAPAIEQRLGIPAESVLAAARNAELRTRVGARGPTLEGYLYPTVYYVSVEARASDVIRQMVDTFEARWKRTWSRRLDSLGVARDEVVTLASIIEGEAPHTTDRPLVSSVYHNRLRRGMRLQADPTVVYALGRRRRLSHADYGAASPYNTYRIAGLPPAPIGQPSEASIAAALDPPDSDFLYFVARPDGRHVFSRTYREHLVAIRRVRRGAETMVIEEPPVAGN